MASDRSQRRLEHLLDQIDQETDQQNWQIVYDLADEVIGLAPDNGDAQAFLAAAERRISSTQRPKSEEPISSETPVAKASQPTSFANGRYEVKRFLGEGGKKRVYLAQDTLLDREVAFALIKTEGLDDVSRTRITLEAQAMGRLGSHPRAPTPSEVEVIVCGSAEYFGCLSSPSSYF